MSNLALLTTQAGRAVDDVGKLSRVASLSIERDAAMSYCNPLKIDGMESMLKTLYCIKRITLQPTEEASVDSGLWSCERGRIPGKSSLSGYSCCSSNA